MRLTRFLLTSFLVLGLASCASKPSTIKLADAILGKWQLAKDTDPGKRIQWDYKNKVVVLKFFENGRIIVLDDPNAKFAVPAGSYSFVGPDAIEILPPQGLNLQGIKESPAWRKTVTVKLDGDTLTLADDKGRAESYTRVPPTPATVKFTGLPLHSDQCVATLKAALEKVPGLSDLTIDRKTRSAGFKLADEDKEGAAEVAIRKLGMRGTAEVNGQKRTLQLVGVLGAPESSKEIVLGPVHACCPACQKVIADMIPEGKVTFEGEGPSKKVRIIGINLDYRKINARLWDAGFGT